CFTDEPIRKGDLVWVYDDRIDRRITAAELAALPAAVRAWLRHYGYAELRDGARVVVLCGDHARHMNHAADPNLAEGADGTNVAARDIAAGEELTCNYYDFDLDAAEKLGPREG